MKYKDELGNWQEIYLKPAGDTLPIGAITAYASEIVPTNWLLCDGQEVSRTEYQELFNRIGTTYGTGDGSTTFNLPDLKGKVIAGLNPEDTDFNTLNKVGGEKTHTLTVGEMPSHSHNMNEAHYPNGSNGAWTVSYNTNAGDLISTSAAGSSEPHNNLQPYLVENYIIKAKNSVGLVGDISDIYSESNQDSYSCDYINQKIANKLNNILEPTILFEGETTGNITLNDDLSNYSYIEIFWHSMYNKDQYCNKIYEPNGKKTTLFYLEGAKTTETDKIGNSFVFWSTMSFSNQNIIRDSLKHGLTSLNGNLTENVDRVIITRVIGYK